jgi:hypothetical protein
MAEFTLFNFQSPKGFVFAVAIRSGDARRRVDLGLGFCRSVTIAAASVIFEQAFKRQSDLALKYSWPEPMDLGFLPLELVSLVVV